MNRILLFNLLIFILLPALSRGQACEMTEVNANALACDGNYFFVSVDIEATNTSPGFTLAGNGTIYGTFLYSDLPVTVGPLLGDNESTYEFIAWDVEDPSCQQFTILEAPNCGPVCQFSNVQLDSLSCVNNNFALVELDFDHQGNTSNVFNVFYENGVEVGSWLYESLPVTITSFAVNGSDPIILTICDDNNSDCCQTFTLDAIDCNPNNCEIFNLTVDPECTGSNFVVHLDFDFENVASDSFTLNGNGLNYGIFGYNELPLTLGPLNGGTNIQWEFVVRDSELASCQEVEVLGIYNCPPPCDVLAIEAEAIECNGNEAYVLSLGFVIEGEGDNGFSVFSESTYYGTFEYEDLPLILPEVELSGSIVDVMTVCDNDTPDCCATIEYLALPCSSCIIYNISAIPQPCNAENEIFVLLDFDFQNVSDLFTVTGNGMQYGTFSYDDVPVLIGPFPGTVGQVLEFVVTDVGNGDCFDAIELGLVACDSICDLSNLVVETGDCTGNNSYVVTLDFDFENVSGLGFDLFANGEFYDFYNYNQLPLTILEFPSSGNNLDTITICDNDNPDCCITHVFEAEDCECNIFDATIIPTGCSSDSTFGVSLEFFYQNLPGDFVDVFFDGVFIGFYSVNDIPLQIDNIPEGSGTGVLSVCANDLNNCCDEVVVELVNCEGPECEIWDLIAEAGECNSDTTFLLDIVFNENNLPVDSVLIYANDELIGQFFNEPDFIRIEHFPVMQTSLTTLTVCAVNAPDCCDTYTFETPDCITTDCEIWDLVADPGICLTDSTYILVIEYNSENVPGDMVVVTANGNVIDTFLDPDEHIVIEHFPWFDGNEVSLTVCSVEFPDCCDSYEFEIPNCPGGGDCNIFDLVVNFEGCQTDSTYTVAVNFESENLPNGFVNIYANGELLGEFPENNGHIILENFPVLPTNHTVVTVCANSAPDCCDVYEFETPNCAGGDSCIIAGLVVNFEGCLTDSTYFVAVNFDYANLPGDSVTIHANDQLIGHFPVQNGHILIEHFPVLPTPTTLVTVCAFGTPDCCDVYEFLTPDCTKGEECVINITTIELGNCLTDSTFILEVHFEFENLPTDSVIIDANGQIIGQFQVHEGQIVIEHFPVFDGNLTEMHVCAVGAPDCCDVFVFETPDCEGGEECDIFEIAVDVQSCTSDSTFGAVINFQWENISAGGFDVWAGTDYLGFFPFDQVPVVTSSFPSNITGQYLVTICESDNKDCCESFVFEGPVCSEGACDIFNLEWTMTECDGEGNFFFILDFDYNNVGNEGFSIVGNGNNYGNFEYENIPIELGPFMENNTVYEFLVIDGENSACFDFVVPGIVDCTVGTNDVNHDDVFQVFNNGTVPAILPLTELKLSVFTSNGRILVKDKVLSEGDFFELNGFPGGLYIGYISSGGNMWPVKLVKSAH